MSKITFAEDASSRKVTRLVFVFQVSAMIAAAGLSLIDYLFPALVISGLVLIISAAGILWLYFRYRNLPLLREKAVLKYFVSKFQKHALIDAGVIQSAIEERERLIDAEQEELDRALADLQKSYVENGLADAMLHDVVIPGVNAESKKQFVQHRILSAAQITERSSQLPGVTATERQALHAWKRSVAEELHRTRPRQLSEKQRQPIQQKYQALQEKNGAVESRARSSRELLQHEIASFRQRLRELEELTFGNYLGMSLLPAGWRPRPARSKWS